MTAIDNGQDIKIQGQTEPYDYSNLNLEALVELARLGFVNEGSTVRHQKDTGIAIAQLRRRCEAREDAVDMAGYLVSKGFNAINSFNPEGERAVVFVPQDILEKHQWAFEIICQHVAKAASGKEI